MPLGALLLLAGLLVAPALAGRQRDVRNGTATRQVATFGIGPQVADQDDFVDSARHITLLRCSIKGPPAIPARARPRRRSDTCSGKSREQILLFRPAACHWARADYCPVSPGRPTLSGWATFNNANARIIAGNPVSAVMRKKPTQPTCVASKPVNPAANCPGSVIRELNSAYWVAV